MPAEGGTAHGHSVSDAHAHGPRGPHEPAPPSPVLAHSGTGLPVQSTGHAGPGARWQQADGRPRVGPVRERHPAPAAWHTLQLPPERDHFGAGHLAPYWISPRGRP
jgi:hypothetical protein